MNRGLGFACTLPGDYALTARLSSAPEERNSPVKYAQVPPVEKIKMGGMQRRKGAVGEREIVQEMNRLGMLCRRTAQYCGKAGTAADVVCEGLALHVEVKRTERLKLWEAIAQAQRDAKGRPFIVLHRANGKPWIVIQLLEHWVEDSVQACNARAVRREKFDAIEAPEDI